MRRNIVLMAKSKKGNDGYCIAGIDTDSGEWVRLNAPGYYSIPRNMFKYPDGMEPELLDLFSVEITGKDDREFWQPENLFCRLNTFEKESDLREEIVLKRLQEDRKREPLLYNYKPFIETDWLNNYSGEKYSLIAIEPEKLRFIKKNEKVVTAAFMFKGTNYSGIRITDLEFLEKCANQKNNQYFYADRDYLLVMSLGLPFVNDYSGREENWKLIASVIEKSRLESVFESEKEEPVNVSGEFEITDLRYTVYEALREKRLELARKEGVPAYCVVHDRALREIAETMPETLDELLKIKWMGSQNVGKYGHEILSVLKQFYDKKEADTQEYGTGEDIEVEFTIESAVSDTKSIDFDLLLKMLTVVAEGIDHETGEIINVEEIINNKAFEAAIKAINKRYKQSKPRSSQSGKGAADIYSEYEKRFPDAVIIRKEGFFYTTRNDSAIRLHDIVGYKLNKDNSGRYITGGPKLELITEALKNRKISYVLIVGDEIKEEYLVNGDFEKEAEKTIVRDNQISQPVKEEKECIQEKEEGEERSCNNCKLYRIGECAGLGGLCDDYEYAPTTSEEERENWPDKWEPYDSSFVGRRKKGVQ